MLGFIITRHVNSQQTNKYWIESYNSIRKYYPLNTIMIIDDNSDKKYISIPNNLNLINCFIIQSEFPQRGEILAYYYFNKYPLFDKAVIIHDSVFIKELINFEEVKDIKFIWHFQHDWDDCNMEKMIINTMDNPNQLLIFYDNKDQWYGCFGVQSVISRNFLNCLVTKYRIFDLLNVIDTREKRMAFERVFALICNFENPDLCDDTSLYGTIHSHGKWGLTYDEYLKNPPINTSIVKVWSGR
jgi:hypothetical protein